MLLLIARRLKYCWGNTHAWPSVHQHRRYFPGSAVTTSLGDGAAKDHGLQRIMWGPMWVKTCSGLVLKMWDLQLISGLQRRKIMCINLIFQDMSGLFRRASPTKKVRFCHPTFPILIVIGLLNVYQRWSSTQRPGTELSELGGWASLPQ